MALIFVDRSTSSSILQALIRPNRALLGVLGVVALTLSGTMLWDPAQALFGFADLPTLWLAIPRLRVSAC